MVWIPIKPISRLRKYEDTPDIELMTKSGADVSDKEYFRLLEENSLYLFSRFSQEKINKWREGLRSTDEDTFGRSQDKLKKIGESLGKIGSRREENYIEIVLTGDAIEKEIRENGIDKAPLKERHRYLKEHYNIEADNSIKTAGQMANAVISKTYNNLSIATVSDYRKKRKRIISGYEKERHDMLKKQEAIFQKNEQFAKEHPETYESMLIRIGTMIPSN